jgi:putative transcriptional regulator
VSRQTVNAIETGKYDPSLPLAFSIARLFDQSIEAIFEPGCSDTDDNPLPE